jgi:hypothetical protein
MFKRTHTPEAPWWIVRADDKKKGRLNCIRHLLSQVPFTDLPYKPIELPERVHHDNYARAPVPPEMIVPDHYA